MKQRIGLSLAATLALGACTASTPAPPGPASPPASASASPVATPMPSLAPGVNAVLDVRFLPSGIVAGTDALWAEDHASTNQIYALDPVSGDVLATIAVARPCDLAFAFDRIWVADLNTGSLLWIDPATREIGGEIPDLEGPCGVQAVDGAIWLAVDQGLARVDPASETVTVQELAEAAFPGAGMPLWATLYSSGDLVRVDTASGAATLTVPHPGGPTEGPPLAMGFGALWVGDGGADHLYRLDPVTGAVLADIEAPQPTRLLVTDGGVWLTSFPQGVVARIDPTTNAVVYRARLGGNLNGITEGFGAIWVADTANGLLYRIDPAAEGVAP